VRRLHLSIVALALIGYAAWSIDLALLAPSWLYWAGAGAAASALLAMLLSSRCAAPLMALIALHIAAEWLLSLWFSFRIGYFWHASLAGMSRSFVPGFLLSAAALYCCLVAWRLVGRR
jgi:hypothetical protein